MRKYITYYASAKEIKDYPDRFGYLGSIAYDILNIVYDFLERDEGCADIREFMWETKISMEDAPSQCFKQEHINIAMENKKDAMQIATSFEYHDDDNYIIDAHVLVRYTPTGAVNVFEIQLEHFFDNTIHVVPDMLDSYLYPDFIKFEL